MPPDPSATSAPPDESATPDGFAPPYGLLGLILSSCAILALTVALCLAAAVMVVAGLAAVEGVPAGLALVQTTLEGLKAGSRLAERFDVVVGIASYVAVSLAVLAAARFRGGRDWRTLVGWRGWRPRRHWKLFCGLFVLTLLWEVGASFGIDHFHPEAKDWVTAPKETPWLLGFLALAVLFGPIAEELIFRGWMYNSLRASFGLRVAILVTSVLFALAHWESTHLYALAVFPVGLALAFVRERTGSLGASFLFHALYNAVASAMLLAGK